MSNDLSIGVGLDLTELRKELSQLGAEIQHELSALNLTPQQLNTISSLSSMQNSAATANSTRSIAKSSEAIASSVQQLVGTGQQTNNAIRQQTNEQRKQQQTPEGLVHGRYGSYERGTHQVTARMTHAINTLTGMASQGMSDASILRGVGSALGMLGPYGQVAGAVMNLAATGQEQEKSSGAARLRLYKAGGNEARSLYHQLGNASMAGSNLVGWTKGSMQDLGLTRNDIANIILTLSRDVGNTKAIWDVAKLEAGYGLGGSSMSVLKAVAGQGGEADRRALAQVMGVYFAQALERGRIGEAFSFVGKLVQTGTPGVAPNMSEVGKSAEFIGGMGEAYRGDTGASNQALSALRHMATGEGGGASRLFALRAAGLGTGASYWNAVLESSKGLEQGGSNVTRRVVSQYADMPAVKSAWLSGDRARAAVLFSALSGGSVKPYLAERMLESYYAGHGATDVVEGREGAVNKSFDAVKLPTRDRETIDDENRKAWLLERDAYYSDISKQVGADLGGKALENPSIKTHVPVGGFSSLDSFKSAFGNNYGEVRDNDIVNGKYVAGRRIHDAVDINLPPGAPVHLMVGGRVKSVGQAMADAAYGYYIEIEGDDGRLYKYVHLASKPNVAVNTYLKQGTFLGTTMRTRFPGGSKSHLHLAVTDKLGRSVNPYGGSIGINAFNRLLGVPDFKPSFSGFGAATEPDKDVASQVSTDARVGNTPRTSVVGNSAASLVHLDVAVRDDRVSVSHRATRGGNTVVRLTTGVR